MGEALWALWYDLPVAEADRFLVWAHDVYLPSLTGRPDCLWAAHYRNIGYQDGELSAYIRSRGVPPEDAPGLGRGTQYLMIVAMRSVSAAVQDGRLDQQAGDGDDAAMLALREGLRTGLFVEIDRVDGPEAGTRQQGGPPLIQFGSIRARDFAHETEVLKWYAAKRLPDASEVPGVIGARQMACISGWAKFGIIYEFVSFAAHQRHFEPRLERGGMDERWTRSVVDGLLHAPGSPTVAERIWPPVDPVGG